MIILDKGFERTTLNHPCIRYLRATHGWDEFLVHHSENGYAEMVREFYANVTAHILVLFIFELIIPLEFYRNFFGILFGV